MIEQLVGNGGSLGVIVIAVVLLYREVMRGQAIREIKKNGGPMNGLYTIDPRTGESILLPALNFRLLSELSGDSAELLKNEVEQTRLAEESGEKSASLSPLTTSRSRRRQSNWL